LSGSVFLSHFDGDCECGSAAQRNEIALSRPHCGYSVGANGTAFVATLKSVTAFSVLDTNPSTGALSHTLVAAW
jgi:hypothetical protein